MYALESGEKKKNLRRSTFCKMNNFDLIKAGSILVTRLVIFFLAVFHQLWILCGFNLQ